MTTSKKTGSILLIVFIFSTAMLFGQSPVNKVGIGFNINQIQNDFGLGLHLVSPYFANGKAAVRVGGNLQWHQHQQGNEITWSPYGNVFVGIRGRQYIIEDKIYIYGEGGALVLLPNSAFSSEKTRPGGYGLFGFEFYASPNFSYFVELGGLGAGARADKLPAKPIYSNGFITSVGFRVIP